MRDHRPQRARQLELMKVRSELLQRRIGAQFRTVDDAIERAEHLVRQLDALHAQYVTQETAGGLSALALGGIRRKQAEMREAIERQRARLDGLQAEKATLVVQAAGEANKVERLKEMLEANATEWRHEREARRERSITRAG